MKSFLKRLVSAKSARAWSSMSSAASFSVLACTHAAKTVSKVEPTAAYAPFAAPASAAARIAARGRTRSARQ